MNQYDKIVAISQYIFFGISIFLSVAVIIRVIIKFKRKEKIEITPVGVHKDLPSEVTGINKQKFEAPTVIERDDDKDKGNKKVIKNIVGEKNEEFSYE